MRSRWSPGVSLTPIWVLLAINFIFFIASMAMPEAVYQHLGLKPAALLDRPWTIISNIFIHASFWHIFGNMITLYFFGSYLLQLVGENKFLLVYFLGGLLGNVLFIILGPSYAVAVGASGAVFALGGALAVMRPKLKVFIFPIPVPLDLWMAVIGGFLVLSFMPQVAWEAHLGGLVTGLVAGYFFRKKERYTFWR